MKKINLIGIFLISVCIFYAVLAHASTDKNTSDLSIENINCELAWKNSAYEDETKQRLYSQIIRHIYEKNGTTYHDDGTGAEENGEAGDLPYFCDITIKNNGPDDILENTDYRLTCTETTSNNYKNFAIGGGKIEKGLKKGEQMTELALIHLYPYSQQELINTGKFTTTCISNVVMIGITERKIYLNKFLMDIVRQLAGLKINEKINDPNKNNDIMDYTINFGKINFPNEVKNINSKLINDKQIKINWPKDTKAKKYEIIVRIGIGEGSATDLDTYTTSNNYYILNFNETDKEKMITIWIRGVNEYGKGPWPSRDYYLDPGKNKFTDVGGDQAWFSQYVYNAYYAGAVKGYKDTNENSLHLYGPADNVTVAEVAKIITSNIFINEADLPKSTKYVPVEYQNHWAVYYLNYLIEHGYHLVKNDKNPNRPATRADIVRFIMESMYVGDENSIFGKAMASEEVSKELKFIFPDILNHESKNYIQMAYDFGIIDGYPDGTFKPDNYLNRAEMAKIYSNAKLTTIRKGLKLY